MPHASAPWLAALEASSARLAAASAPFTPDDLARPSFASEWTVAQVLSHLGSAAEISSTLLERGVAGSGEGPQVQQLRPIWARWDAMPPSEQRSAWLAADARHRDLLSGLDEAQLDDVRVPYFSGLLDITTYAGYRLSEQSIHAWDVEVSFDDAAVIPATEVDLLLERIDLVATRFRDGDTFASIGPQQIVVDTTDRPGTMMLDIGTELHVYPCAASGSTGSITGTAEEFVRLVYGRHRTRDTIAADGETTLQQLVSLFPGY